ncbi:MAG: hypothetical protein AAF531_14815 [Actinomycetota bacterium]
MKLARRLLTAAAALGIGAATFSAATTPTPAAAIIQPATVDLDTLNMVPERIWGVSGQNPAQTQTESLDVLVWDFAQIGNRMFIGGAFLNAKETKTATPVPQPYVAAFDLYTGDFIDSWRPQLDRAVYSLDILPNGSLLVGGEFETVNGTARQGLVALDPATGAIDQSFTASVDRPWTSLRAVVRDLKLDGDNLYVAGNFSHVENGGGQRTRVYNATRVSAATSGIDGDWRPQVTGSGIWGIDTDTGRGEVHLTGFFTAVNGEADTGNFHTVDDTTGVSAPGKLELARNYPWAQPEFYDVVTGDGTVFAIGEQHIVHVLDADDQSLLGYHTTGMVADTFLADQGAFAGGAYQTGERIGDIVFAGCHCTYSVRNGNISHYSSFSGRRTDHRLVMAYDARTGEMLEQFKPDINSPRDGVWAIASDTNGCLYVGGDLHVGGIDSSRNRWLGGFAKFCSPGWQNQPPPPVAGALVSPGTTWRFDDSGADLGTDWRAVDFDDNAWAAGPTEMGFGDGDEATVLTSGNVTYYARTTFEFSGAVPNGLSLDLAADDGAVVYLNGQEILRDNLPAGTIRYNTGASTWRGGQDEELRNHLVASDALVQGTNTLAVEIHNTWRGNLDLSFDLGLATSDETPAAAPEVELVKAGADWHHTDSTVGAPADWTGGLPGDAATAEFGFGEGDEATVLTIGADAYYFTHGFTVQDAASIDQLDLTLLADDGAVVYLNGTEIHRYNMPDGPITPDSRPLNWVGGADEAFKTVTVPADGLTDGTNTIAVEIHNYWRNNPDLSFDLGLTVTGR